MVPSAAGKGLTGRTIFPMAGGGEVNERSVPFAVVVGAAEGDGVISFTAEANAAAYIVALCYAVGGGENPAGADEGAGTECPTGEDFRHESEVGGASWVVLSACAAGVAAMLKLAATAVVRAPRRRREEKRMMRLSREQNLHSQ